MKEKEKGTVPFSGPFFREREFVVAGVPPCSELWVTWIRCAI